MLEEARQLDQWLMLRINHDWANAFLDHLLPTVTSFAAWTPLIIMAALFAAWRGGFRARTFLVCATLAALLSEGLVGGPLKKLIGRVRPHESMSEVIKRTLPQARPQILAMFRAPVVEQGHELQPGARGKSFPSSHTVNMFAVAAVALIFLGRRGWIFFIAAVLVAWSRVYCGVHWPSDVFGSAPLGLLSGWGVTKLAAALWKKYGERWLPESYRAHPGLLMRDPSNNRNQ